MVAAMEGEASREPSPCLVDSWTFEEQKAFEVALATYYDHADRWQHIAGCVPGKSVQDIQRYYMSLEDDVRRIDGGLVALPAWACDSMAPPPPSLSRRGTGEPKGPLAKKNKVEHNAGGSGAAAAAAAAAAEKRKGVPWTEEEHKLFLLGLAKFGKGDWRSIARTYVVSRTPTQVASHAQKYFIRLNSANKKDKRRASIHDITCASLGDLHGRLAVDRAA